MWVVFLLSSFTERRVEVRVALKRVLERDLESHEKANLILALENMLENTNEEKDFLFGLILNHEHDLVAFAVALVLTTLMKKETPIATVQFLANVMLHIPETVDSFIDLPLGGDPEWRARQALYNLEPQRLEFLVPAVLARWQQASKEKVASLEWAELLLFILFQGKADPQRVQAPFPAAQLTLQQRNVLELFVKNRSTRQFVNFWLLLRSYGFSDSAEALASYLR